MCPQLICFVGEGRAFEVQYKELQQPLQQLGDPATASLQVTSVNDLPIQPSSAMAGVPASGECPQVRGQASAPQMLHLLCCSASWHCGMLQQGSLQRHAACGICSCVRHCQVAGEGGRPRGAVALLVIFPLAGI